MRNGERSTVRVRVFGNLAPIDRREDPADQVHGGATAELRWKHESAAIALCFQRSQYANEDGRPNQRAAAELRRSTLSAADEISGFRSDSTYSEELLDREDAAAESEVSGATSSWLQSPLVRPTMFEKMPGPAIHRRPCR
ncbi:hypothetical protein VNO77_03253 [Canavalia gladiata]|uniref:Uncharacterized protein n=1 Tax=Canavalia gladiata TaxID=3824 RepID=A0AAN9R6Q5_CANGL